MFINENQNTLFSGLKYQLIETIASGSAKEAYVNEEPTLDELRRSALLASLTSLLRTITKLQPERLHNGSIS